jgi:hypothetical protein
MSPKQKLENIGLLIKTGKIDMIIKLRNVNNGKCHKGH